MPLDPKDPLVEWATFGKEVELFMRSPIGDFLLKRSEEEIQEAVGELKRVAPWRRRRIQQLQTQIHVAERFQLWLADAIAAGRQAITQLEEENA